MLDADYSGVERDDLRRDKARLSKDKEELRTEKEVLAREKENIRRDKERLETENRVLDLEKQSLSIEKQALSLDNAFLANQVSAWEGAEDDATNNTMYDIVFEFKDLLELDKDSGWPVRIYDAELLAWFNDAFLGNPNQPPGGLPEMLKKWNSTIVGFLGDYDNGKTFICTCTFFFPLASSLTIRFFAIGNMLSGQNFHSSKRYHTRGLSFKHISKEKTKSPGHDFIMLDTEGSNVPVSTNGQEFERCIAIAKAKEKFQQDLIYAVADLLVVVLNNMKSSDQQLLEILRRNWTSDNAKKKRPIFVVHNLKDVTQESVWQKAWEVPKFRSLYLKISSWPLTTSNTGASPSPVQRRGRCGTIRRGRHSLACNFRSLRHQTLLHGR